MRAGAKEYLASSQKYERVVVSFSFSKASDCNRPSYIIILTKRLCGLVFTFWIVICPIPTELVWGVLYPYHFNFCLCDNLLTVWGIPIAYMFCTCHSKQDCLLI